MRLAIPLRAPLSLPCSVSPHLPPPSSSAPGAHGPQWVSAELQILPRSGECAPCWPAWTRARVVVPNSTRQSFCSRTETKLGTQAKPPEFNRKITFSTHNGSKSKLNHSRPQQELADVGKRPRVAQVSMKNLGTIRSALATGWEGARR